MNKLPLISVIIPIYNAEQYLEDCVDSVISQSYKNLEIILVNDGSVDSSLEICYKFSQVDDRIQIINKENAGVSAARNSGLEICRGDYIVFLDSDDWMDWEALETAVLTAKEENADIVFWGCVKEFKNRKEPVNTVVTDDEKVIFEGSEMQNLRRKSFGLRKEELSKPTGSDAFNSNWAKLIKREILFGDNPIRFVDLKKIGSEDALFGISIYHKAQKAVYINQRFNHYRMYNEASITKNHGNTIFPRLKNLHFVLKDFIREHNLGDDYEQALHNRFALSLINNTLAIAGPRNKISFAEKAEALKLNLNDEEYRVSLKKLEKQYLPVFWKLFFQLAEMKQSKLLVWITNVYFKLKKIK